LKQRGRFPDEVKVLETRTAVLRAENAEIGTQFALLAADTSEKLENLKSGGTISNQDVEMLKRFTIEYKDEQDALEVQMEQLDRDVRGLFNENSGSSGGCDSLSLGAGLLALAGLVLLKKRSGC
jgi:hypothetical protein